MTPIFSSRGDRRLQLDMLRLAGEARRAGNLLRAWTWALNARILAAGAMPTQWRAWPQTRYLEQHAAAGGAW